MKLKARWIWNKQKDYKLYNQTIIAKKTFKLFAIKKADIAITADSFYRLSINGQWVNDGPCRSWPEHYQYDEIDVTSYLCEGENEIEVIGRYFGCGTFHKVPQQAGLLAQIEVTPIKGKKITIITDDSWKITEADAWSRNTPKICCQMEPWEHYDARLEGKPKFSKAAALFNADKGPWKDLNPRDVALMNRVPFHFKRFKEANIVATETSRITFAVTRLLHPGVVEANRGTSRSSGIATVIVSPKKQQVHIHTPYYRLTVNGSEGKDGLYQLQKGDNLLLGAILSHFGHESEAVIWFPDMDKVSLDNPLKPGHENPWCFIDPECGSLLTNDMNWTLSPGCPQDKYVQKFNKEADGWLANVTDVPSFKEILGKQARCIPSKAMILEDAHFSFLARNPVGTANGLVTNPSSLMHDNGEITTVAPTKEGDVELVYDLGEQNCGFYEFDLIATEGTIIDIFGVENINESGRVQHSNGNRNGVRYICKEGTNKFRSLKRRSGRFLFLTIRHQTSPVSIRHLHLIESTYPVNHQGSFSCSDQALDNVWEISARTLKLCMEDTFTDCPLYEQTLWVGDARNEAVFAMTAFGAQDITRRCITLAAQSLERYPIVGCQVPSSWDCLLPAWSFLWGISVWDYYEYSGDLDFLKQTWKWVKKNLEGAEKLSDERGLFSGNFWNMFDWTGIDEVHDTVTHNSMFVVGAINAAIKCADVLKDQKTKTWLKGYRRKLIKAINKLWDKKKKAYPDSVHSDGTISPQTCQHTSFLSILYDIIEKENLPAAIKNCIAPPEEMIKVGSPFAIMYLYEALEKAGLEDEIVKSIYTNYLPMLEEGATTVWESFASGNLAHDGFPTRSHCHAWSSAPVHFLNRIILGIKPKGAGAHAFEISPRLNKLEWAKGATASPNGPVKVSWKKVGRTLNVTASAPAGVKIKFVKNDTHKNLKVVFNDKVMQDCC